MQTQTNDVVAAPAAPVAKAHKAKPAKANKKVTVTPAVATVQLETVKAGAGLEAAAVAQVQATKGALADANVQEQIAAVLAAKASRKGKKAQAKAVEKAVAAVVAKAPVVVVPAGTAIIPTKGQPKLTKKQMKAAKAKALTAAGPKVNTKAQAKAHAEPANKKVKGTARAGTKGGYHIEKDREAQGGITKRSAGTKGNKLWHLYANLADKAGGLDKLEPQAAKAAAVKAGYNETTAGIAFYRYRRFSGIVGRVGLKKALSKAERKAAKASQAKAPKGGKGKAAKAKKATKGKAKARTTKAGK